MKRRASASAPPGAIVHFVLAITSRSAPTAHPPRHKRLQLEDPETARIRELTELARLFEKNLITSEEYNKAKNQILKVL